MGHGTRLVHRDDTGLILYHCNSNSNSSSSNNNNNSNNKTYTVEINPDLHSSKWEVGTGNTHPNNNIGLISDPEDTPIKETNIPNKT